MSEDLGTALIAAARDWPQRDAYRFNGTAINYGELADRARAMAACLIDQGVTPGDRVAIAMTKGLDMPVAIHGIWMAGAAFVPFDPSAPVARLAGILRDCEISVVLSADRNQKLAAALAAEHPITVIGAEVDGAQCVQPDPERLADPHHNRRDDLAYIIFTSGSTGVPKGICHTHASGLAFARTWVDHYHLSKDDVFFSTVPLHFDFSLADFFTPAMVGAVTELVPEQVLLFPASLAAHLEKTKGTIWSSVPYTFIQLCERGAVETRDLSCLRWLIYGGEPLPPAKLPLLRQTFSAEISNSYGPAEVNQVSEYSVPLDHPEDTPIPIGYASNHATLRIGDEDELLVASSSMMRGYWNRPDLNQDAFVHLDGTRFYRTGDRVYRDDKGLWMFAGREDRQIKLRGHRIELDEVEMALAAHDAVSEAAVVVSEDGVRLQGFVTLVPNIDVTGADLITHAKGVLPSYAVPDHIEIRPSFEKTSTGKINRRVLAKEAP